MKRLKDIELYESVLDDLLEKTVDDNTELSATENRPSLVGIVGYACSKDIDLDRWLPRFFKKNQTYIKNQKDNLLYMINDLKSYFNLEQAVPIAV